MKLQVKNLLSYLSKKLIGDGSVMLNMSQYLSREKYGKSR
jgi:hypothetical protein